MLEHYSRDLTDAVESDLKAERGFQSTRVEVGT